ncbi:MAG: EAL domain-containing protein [Erysipelotrichaceae bacterium]
MQKRMVKIIMVIALFVVFLIPGSNVLAIDKVRNINEDREIVRVGYSELQGYAKLVNGKYVGYGPNYLKKIEELSNFKFEYVKCEGQVCYDLLREGRIDILGFVEKGAVDESMYRYSKYSYGEYRSFLLAPYDSTLKYEDYDAWNNIHIGTPKNGTYATTLQQQAKEKGFSYRLSIADTTGYLLSNLANGNFDAILTNNTLNINTSTMKRIADFGAIPFYFITNQNQADLMKRLEAIMIEIKQDYPQFESSLNTMYFDDETVQSYYLTQEEKAFLANIPEIKIAISPNYFPIEAKNGTDFHGVSMDILQDIQDYLGITFSYVEVEHMEEALRLFQDGVVDGISLFPVDYDLVSNFGLMMSDPYYVSQEAMVMKQNFRANGRVKLGVPERYKYFGDFGITNTALYDLSYYPTYDATFEALLKGEVDQIIINEVYANYQIQRKSLSNYYATPLNAAQISYTLVVDHAYGKIFQQSLNKAILKVRTEKGDNYFLNSIISSTTSEFSLRTYLEDNLNYVLATFLFFAFFYLWRTGKRRRDMNKMIYNLENTDPIFGVPNRLCLSRNLKQRHLFHNMRLVLVELKDLHIANNMYGNTNTNKFVGSTISYMQQICKEAKIYRYSGNDFVLLFEDVSDEKINIYLHNLSDRFQMTWEIDEIQFSTRVQFGLINCNAQKLMTSSMVETTLNTLKFHMKDNHNQVIDYNREMDKDYHRKNALLDVVKSATANKKFEVFLQPIYNVRTKSFSKAEALLRLFDEEYGFVSPLDIIQIAESNGFIGEIGLQVLEQVCIKLQQFQEDGIEIEHIAVNVSVAQMMENDFARLFTQMVDKYQLPHHKLKIEITESIFVNELETVNKQIEALLQAGFLFSIDDFGTGYSSFSYLIELPIDEVKIDRSFIQKISVDEKSKLVIQAIIDVAHNLNYRVVAEGIENRDEVEFLSKCGVDYIQGYYYAKPLSIHKVNGTIKGLEFK